MNVRLLLTTAFAVALVPEAAFAICAPAVTVTTPGTITTPINSSGTGLFVNLPVTGGNNTVSVLTSITAACSGVEAKSFDSYNIQALVGSSITVTGLGEVDGIVLDAIPGPGSPAQTASNNGTITVQGVNAGLVAGMASFSSLSPINQITNAGAINVLGTGGNAFGILAANGIIMNTGKITFDNAASYNAAAGIVVSNDGGSIGNTGQIIVMNQNAAGVVYGVASGPGAVVGGGGPPQSASVLGSQVVNGGAISAIGTTTKSVIGISASPNSIVANQAGAGINSVLIGPTGPLASGPTDLYLSQGIAVLGGTTVFNDGSIAAFTGAGAVNPPNTLHIGIGSLNGPSYTTTDTGGNHIYNTGVINTWNDFTTSSAGILLKSGNNTIVNQATGLIQVAGVANGVAAIGNNNALTNFGSINEIGTAANGGGILNFVGMVAGNFGNGLTTSTSSQIYNVGTISSQVFGSVGMWLAGNGILNNNAGSVITMVSSGAANFIDGSGFTAKNIFNGAGNVGMIAYLPGAPGTYPNTSSNASVQNDGQVSSTYGVGVAIIGTGTSFTNTSQLIVQGAGSVGVGVVGANNTINNSGEILAAFPFPTFALMDSAQTSNLKVTNLPTGIIEGQIDLSHGLNETLINQGKIKSSDSSGVPGQQFSINGTFTQTSTGSLDLRIDSAGHFDKLTVTQVLNAGGTLDIVPSGGNFTPRIFDSTSKIQFPNMIDPPVINGQFDHVNIVGTPFFTATAIYSPGAIDIVVGRTAFNGIAGLTPNQFAVGSGLEAGGASATSPAAVAFYNNVLFMTAKPGQGYDALSGEGTSGTQNASFFAGSLFGMGLLSQAESWRRGDRTGVVADSAQPLGYAAEKRSSSAFAQVFKAPPAFQPSWRAWGSGLGGGQSVNGDRNDGSANLTDRTAGGALGFDYDVNPNLLIGLGAGATTSSFSVPDRLTTGQIDGGLVGAYGMQRWGASYLSALVSYGGFSNSTNRTIAGVGPTETATGKFWSDQIGARVELGKTWKLAAISVTPFAALQVSELWQRAYTETSTAAGAPGMLGLNYAAIATTSLPTYLGSQFDTRVTLSNGMIWSPFVRAAWVHEFFPSRQITASFMAAPVASFTVNGAHAAPDAAAIDAGSQLALSANAALMASFHGEFAPRSQSYAGTGSLRIAW